MSWRRRFQCVWSRGVLHGHGGNVAVLVGLALSLGMIIGVQAATIWTVCASRCGYTSIEAAISAPATVDGDTLAIAAGVYAAPGITLDKSLTLQGEDDATTIVRAVTSAGTAPDRVFTIASGVTATIRGLTIRNGSISGKDYPRSSRGGLYNAGPLPLTHSSICGYTTEGSGGGLINFGPLTLTHSIVAKNPAGGIAPVPTGRSPPKVTTWIAMGVVS